MPPNYAMYDRRMIFRPIFYVLMIFFLLIILSSFPSSFYREFLARGASKDWDVLIFTQNWPVSVCLAWEYKGKCNSCLPTQSSNSWTIHGVWPTKLGTIGPAFCNTSRPFNPESIYGLQDDLEKRWSPIEKHKNKYMFWGHEWEKHGTCAAQLDSLNSEFDYFYQGIQWHKQYNMSVVLEKAGVVPGQSYNVSQIYSNVREVVGKTLISAAFTIPICFDKNLTLTDCDGTKLKHRRSKGADYTDCRTADLIEFPLSTPYPPPIHIQEKHYVFDILKTLELISWATW